MTNGWALRYYREGDEQGILDCLTAAFGSWPGVDIDVPPIEHLRWKLSSHPILRRYNYVAVDGERIVGCQLIFVQRVKDRDRALLADACTDYAVHPDYQGQGLSRELWTFDPDGFASAFDLITSISDSRVVQYQVRTIGSGRSPANALEWLERSDEWTGTSAPAALRIRAVDEFDGRIDEFCSQALQPFDLAILRDRTYLNWRYADPRAGRYAIRIAEESGEMLGYSVLTISRGKGFIADLLVLPGRVDAVEALAEDAARRLTESGLSSIRCWCAARHPYRDVLLNCGYRPLRRVEGFGFGLQKGKELPTRDDPEAAVHFTVGDTDIV